jgi:hypothetical protein
MTDGTTSTETHTERTVTQSPTTVESWSFEWSAGYGTTKTALFRVRPAHAVLQHVRTVTLSQRAPSTCEIDTDASLEDVPRWVLDELRSTGRDIAAGGGRV